MARAHVRRGVNAACRAREQAPSGAREPRGSPKLRRQWGGATCCARAGLAGARAGLADGGRWRRYYIAGDDTFVVVEHMLDQLNPFDVRQQQSPRRAPARSLEHARSTAGRSPKGRATWHTGHGAGADTWHASGDRSTWHSADTNGLRPFGAIGAGPLARRLQLRAA